VAGHPVNVRAPLGSKFELAKNAKGIYQTEWQHRRTDRKRNPFGSWERKRYGHPACNLSM
jgi:hypothetical protein